MKNSIFVCFLLLYLAVISTGCNDSSISPYEELPDVYVKQSTLVFKNQETFDNIRNSHIELSEEQLDQWEKQFDGFISQRAIYNNSLDLDALHKSNLEKKINQGELTFDEVILDNGQYDPFVKENKVLFNFKDDGSYDLKVAEYNPFIANYINKEGIVQIGRELHYFGDKVRKVIVDGDYKKIHELSEIKESSLDHNVMVYKITTLNEEIKSDNIQAFSGSTDCRGTIGSDRVEGKAVLGYESTIDIYGTLGYPGQLVSSPYAYLTATNYGKGIFGWSKKRTGYLRIDGIVSYDIGPFSGSSITIAADTGGDLEKSLYQNVLSTNQWFLGNYYVPYLFYGTIIFTGRNNCKCII